MAKNENYQNYPYFEAKFIEVVPVRTTLLIKHPMMLRYQDIRSKEEIVCLTEDPTFMNLSRNYTYVRVYHSNRHIIKIFPAEFKK
jgi:hypothetical protein